MTGLALSLIAVALLLLLFALSVWRTSPERSSNRRFAAFTIAVACWAIGVGGSYSGYHIVFWVKFTFACASLIPVAFLIFIQSFPALPRGPSPGIVCLTVAGGFLFALLSIATSFIVYDPIVTTSEIVRKAGVLYSTFATYIILTWGTALSLFLSKWRNAKGADRAQLQYLGAGMIVPGAGVITTNLLIPLFTGRSTYSWIGPFFGLAFVAIVGHAIIRHRLMDMRLVIHRGLTVAVSTVLSSLPVVAFLVAFWPQLVSQLDGLELTILLVVTTIVTLLIPITRDITIKLLDRYVYRTHANYQRTVREASQMLTRLLNMQQLLPFISRTIVTATGAEGVAIYVLDENTFTCTEVNKRHASSRFDPPGVAPSEVIEALARVREPLLADEVARERPTPEIRALSAHLARANWSLILPVLSENGVIGAIAVGPKLSGDPFYPQDLDLLMTLANQAGIAIKNAQLYAQVVLANEYIENIVATIESGVIAITFAGRIAMFNRAAERLTGIAAAGVMGQPVDVLPANLAQALADTVADGRARTQPEVELPCAAPAEGPVSRPVICTTSPLRDPAGSILGAVAVFSDLTPLKELQIERRRAERLAYFEVLASGIAHEIKNPLVAIKTFGQLLPRRHEDAKFVNEFGRVVTREIERMERLVDRLRALSRPGERPRHPIDVRGPIADALESLRAIFDEKSVTVTARLGSEPCVVVGNPGELEQLYLNLLINAHEATPPGGAVIVELTRTDSHIATTVGDTGPGISPDLLERVFDPFFTTKQHGSGLGLAICAGIAQTHGARLRAANRPGGGAVFIVEFPVVAVPVSATA